MKFGRIVLQANAHRLTDFLYDVILSPGAVEVDRPGQQSGGAAEIGVVKGHLTTFWGGKIAVHHGCR